MSYIMGLYIMELLCMLLIPSSCVSPLCNWIVLAVLRVTCVCVFGLIVW